LNKTIFPEYDLGLQYRIMAALAETPVKVPPLFGLEQNDALLGVQFYIMERIPGVVISDLPPYHMGGWMHDDCTPEQRTRMWWKGLEAMGEVHLVDSKTPAFDFLAEKARETTPLTQQLQYWDRCFSEGLGVPRLEGLPGVEETISAWENQTGFKADQYHYYEVFAGLRFALIISRIFIINNMEEMVIDNFVTGILAKILEEGWRE
jgi:aminoglycoside phosphotransferase (APT) family kinase protein